MAVAVAKAFSDGPLQLELAGMWDLPEFGLSGGPLMKRKCYLGKVISILNRHKA